MRVLAFGNHAPDEVIGLLKKAGVPRSAILVCASGQQIPKRNKHEYILFLSLNDLRKQTFGPSYKTASMYVFDDPLRLFKVGLLGADFTPSDNIHLDGLTMSKLDSLPPARDVEFSKLTFTGSSDIVFHATEEVKAQKTFLNQFMTFIYSMPSATHQKPIKELVCKWMASKESLAKFNKRLDEVCTRVHMTAKQRLRITELLSSEVTDLYRRALHEDGDEDDVAKRMQVSAYELRYIRAINRVK